MANPHVPVQEGRILGAAATVTISFTGADLMGSIMVANFGPGEVAFNYTAVAPAAATRGTGRTLLPLNGWLTGGITLLSAREASSDWALSCLLFWALSCLFLWSRRPWWRLAPSWPLAAAWPHRLRPLASGLPRNCLPERAPAAGPQP